MDWRPRSLESRQLWASTLVLLAFLLLTGLALDRAFRTVATQALRERLENQAMDYLATLEFDRSGNLIPPDSNPDPRLNQPGSGLYAQVAMTDGVAWSSPSAVGPQLPQADHLLEGGTKLMEGPLPMVNSDGTPGSVYRFGYGLLNEGANDDSGAFRQAWIPYTIYISEDAGTLPAQVSVFRRALWGVLGGGALVLLLLQGGIMRWSLLPLRKVVAELRRVQRGQAQRMSDFHPRELATLTESINALIDSEREGLERQRNLLADLAHSLKTPLAVARTRLDSDDDDTASLRADVDAQLQRMNDIVTYQLKRAASGGHALYATPIAIQPHAELIVQGLEKIHARRGIYCEFEIDEAARFHGEPGDLQELLGNLLENAFKWTNARVLLTVRNHAADGVAGLTLRVEDDGPGIAPDKVEAVLQRGVRGDERVQGHGIGLAIVQDIVESYRGTLTVTRSSELGGAAFEIILPQAY